MAGAQSADVTNLKKFSLCKANSREQPPFIRNLYPDGNLTTSPTTLTARDNISMGSAFSRYLRVKVTAAP